VDASGAAVVEPPPLSPLLELPLVVVDGEMDVALPPSLELAVESVEDAAEAEDEGESLLLSLPLEMAEQ
jgi:hypothetical protein